LIEQRGIMKQLQDIFRGKKVILNGKDFSGCEIEGYNIGEKYEVDEIRIRNSQVQIFLKGNIHGYPLQSFYLTSPNK